MAAEPPSIYFSRVWSRVSEIGYEGNMRDPFFIRLLLNLTSVKYGTVRTYRYRHNKKGRIWPRNYCAGRAAISAPFHTCYRPASLSWSGIFSANAGSQISSQTNANCRTIVSIQRLFFSLCLFRTSRPRANWAGKFIFFSFPCKMFRTILPSWYSFQPLLLSTGCFFQKIFMNGGRKSPAPSSSTSYNPTCTCCREGG